MGNKNNNLEQKHNEFGNDDLYNQMIKDKIEYAAYYKFDGIAPEGFTLIPIEVLEDLKDFENWKDFKNDPEWIKKKSINYLVV